jgi:phycocyanobilin lyase subunit alpha
MAIDDSFQETGIANKTLTIEEAIADLNGEDRGSRYYAAWWLGRFRVKEPEAISALIAALDDVGDRTPDGGYPLRRNAARALGKLGDIRAVPMLIECLQCDDFYVRETAAEALGKLQDPAAIPHLIPLLAGGLAAAMPIPGSPTLAQPYDAVIEALGSLHATEAIPLIEPFLQHPLDLIQYASARAMYQLTEKAMYGDRLIQALEGDKLQLRRAALSDLGAVGYLKAADAIAQTLAENSLKLIALKGIVEYQVKKRSDNSLSSEVIHVLELMDGLL